jgi:hypothetical protein
MTRWEGKENMHFSPGAAMLLSPGAYGNVAYIAADNLKVYALDTEKGEPVWVYSAGSTIDYQPFVSDDDVFLSVARKGLMRLDRLNGEPRWKTAAASADRVIASNPKFVYALDRESRLVVLDRARGTEVSRLDSRDFPYPIVNEHSDRIFLAAHDGTILCLYDRDYPTQRIMKNSAADDGGQANPIYLRLQQNVTIKEALADKPLRTVFDYFDKELRLPIIVRKEAFPNKAAMDAYLEQPVTLEQAVGVPLSQVLGMLLRKDNIKAKYSVRPGFVLVEPLAEKK